MASSSYPSFSYACVPTRGSTYDVFLSFRGEDTRNSFVDHLYDALVRRGIHTFKDDKMLGGGKPIAQELMKAIKESKFAVVVFSKDYANSSWCLEELSKIMECHNQMWLKVFPVFYHVNPSDVCKQKGKFFTASQEDELNFNGEKNVIVNKWRNALAAATNLCGYHISNASGGETTTINKIVQQILHDIQPRDNKNDLIGIQSHMDALSPLLNIEATEEVRFIGIFGMGGIGKTTIARSLFGRIAHWFQGSSFINDVRNNSARERDICSLQKQILTDALGTFHKFIIKDTVVGAGIIRNKFCNKKVLLVLDDVDDVKQLEFLAGGHDWFGPGSRIIITTRDEHMLSQANFKYKPALLRIDQSLQLFSRHAFNKDGPPDEFEEFSNRAIRYAGRLPLALKVLGSFFRGREVDVWESALDRLAKMPNTEVVETLKLSFDGLEEFEKKIFLDIAFFFKGRKLEEITRVLSSFDFFVAIGLRVLIEKSLITISKKRLYMHDLIQQMGWQVVSQSAPDSRLRNFEVIHDIILENKKLELVEAIVNPRERLKPKKLELVEAIVNPRERHFPRNVENYWPQSVFHKTCCCDVVFKSMKNLRLLYVKRNFTCHKPTFLPHELRWLCWDEYPFSSLPLENMCKLVGLQLCGSEIKYLWKRQKIMPHLKFIELVNLDSLLRFPDVSKASYIERLVLSQCGKLVEVHESLGLLKRLVYLEMNNCWNLKYLPSRFEMECLDTLILSGCHSLERLPEFSPCMSKLSCLDVSYSHGLKEMPSSIKNFSNLSILNIGGCRSLNKIPNSISLTGCSNELHLPQVESVVFHDLTNLCSLRKLNLSMNEIRDQDFPNNLYRLSSLKELDLTESFELTKLPESIYHLSSLTHMCLSFCCNLRILCGLPSGIQVLDARNCMSLEVIEDLSEKCKWLNKIHLYGCQKLLLKDKQNERYMDKMLKQSFLKKWAAIDGSLSIDIPGSKIPCWFKEQQQGSKTTLKLPSRWQTEIIGFAVCGVFRQRLSSNISSIKFRFENDGKLVPILEVDCINTSATTTIDDWNENLWIGYVSLSLLETTDHNDDDDWSHMTQGNLIIELTCVSPSEPIRCGAHILYKEDVESSQQFIKPSISSSYHDWNWNVTHERLSRNTIVCRQ